MSRRNIIILLIGIALVAIMATYGIVEVWNLILLEPILNFLVLLSSVFFGSFGIAIIVLVIIVRLLMLPLSLRQLRSTRAMQALSPKLQEVQKKYAKDQQKLRQEIATVYKESGVSPLGCVWPMLVQFPIWIALYQSIRRALAASPEELLGLYQNLYSSPIIHKMVPLEENFLWLNLGVPDSWFILAILCGGSMWVLQKMSTVASPDPRAQSMARTMIWMMPLMFALFTFMVPSGLAVFWVVSNIIGIVTQYFITGWGSLFTRAPAPAAQPVKGQVAETAEGAAQQEKLATEEVKAQKRVEHAKSRDKRKDRGRSSRARSKKTRRKS